MKRLHIDNGKAYTNGPSFKNLPDKLSHWLLFLGWDFFKSHFEISSSNLALKK